MLKLKKTFFASLFGAAVVLFSPAYQTLAATTAADVEDGTYSVNFTGVEMDSEEVHIQDINLTKPATVEVANGVITVTMGSKGRILKFLNPATGEYVDYTINGTGEGNSDYTSDYQAAATAPRTYQFTVTDLEEPITTQFPAGQSSTGYLTFRILFDVSTITRASGAAAAGTTGTSGTTAASGTSATAAKTTAATSTTQKVTTPKTGDKFVYTLAGIAVVMMSLTGITVYSQRKKAAN